MKAPIYARKPEEDERRELLSGLKSPEGITVRRSQIILLSADQKMKAKQIGQQLGLSDQMVRKVIHAFNESGTAILELGSRARHDDQRAYDWARSSRPGNIGKCRWRFLKRSCLRPLRPFAAGWMN